ncbi:MAG TPA: PIN domain-containing protein [Bellilinea sp.]|nr:PIN domain-containing protein [Bellilinea sp.]
MSIGIVDTTVILHYFRNYAAARAWVDSQPVQLSVTSVTWLEVMEGASSKANQAESRRVLDKFEMLYLTATDQVWAMEQLERFQFSHHIGMNDCLIASVAYRLRIPLYTHNIKDMAPLLGELAVKPYA